MAQDVRGDVCLHAEVGEVGIDGVQNIKCDSYDTRPFILNKHIMAILKRAFEYAYHATESLWRIRGGPWTHSRQGHLRSSRENTLIG